MHEISAVRIQAESALQCRLIRGRTVLVELNPVSDVAHALAWDAWNFRNLHPEDHLVKDGTFGFVQKSDWYILHDDVHFLAVDPTHEQTLVGSSLEKVDFKLVDFEELEALCRESIK